MSDKHLFMLLAVGLVFLGVGVLVRSSDKLANIFNKSDTTTQIAAPIFR